MVWGIILLQIASYELVMASPPAWTSLPEILTIPGDFPFSAISQPRQFIPALGTYYCWLLVERSIPLIPVTM